MQKNVLYTTSTFNVDHPQIAKKILELGVQVIKNPFKRTLTKEEVLELLARYKPMALLAGTEPLDCEVLMSASTFLKVISRVGTGWNNVDHKAAQQLGISVFRTQDAVTDAVVELTIGLIFNLSRHISAMDRDMHAGLWEKRMGYLLQGKQLGIVGCGRIGKKVAKAMQMFGMQVKAYDPFEKNWCKEAAITQVNSLLELVAQVDVVSIHCEPQDDKVLFDHELISYMKDGSLLINIARGQLIDESALYAALSSGKLAGAALDVYAKEPYKGPLADLPNTLLTPHVGSYAFEARTQMELDAVSNIAKGLL